MVVCLMKGLIYEQLAEELNKAGIWKAVLGCQRVDFNRRIAMVVEDPEIRTFFVENGFNVNGVHVFFPYHKRTVDLKTRVYISQLPIDITPLELREVFAFFGEIVEVQVNYITKVIQGRRIDTGDRVLIFKQVRHHIPSYVFVRGWRAFVKYAGQTCRICGLTGHFVKDCPES